MTISDADADPQIPMSDVDVPTPTLEAIPDELEAIPDPVLDLPPTRDPILLPIRSLTWVNFERLCVRLARDVEGLRSVRRYGRAGQGQHGLDVLGMMPSGEYVVYQARDIEKLTGPALKKAVDDYVTQGRAFGAARFVLAVACDVGDKKVDEELAAARERYPDLEIELYDAECITELLRGQREIVEQFFTSAWADIFSPRDGEAVERTRPVRTIDELLHGPLEALNLTGEWRRANELRKADPQTSAEIYGQLRSALEDRGYDGHAGTMWREQAMALQEAGQTDAAFHERHALALHKFERGEHLGAELARMDELVGEDPRRIHMLEALAAANAWLDDPNAIEALREAVVALDAIDPDEARRAGTWLADFAVVDRRIDVLTTHMEMLARLAEPAEQLRLRLSLAEATGHEAWAEIGRAGTAREYSGPLSGLSCMRAGRWAAWHGDSETAVALYRRAIEFATDAGLQGDAQTCLRATLGIALRYGEQDPLAIQETLNIVNSLDAEPTFVEGRVDARMAALRELDDRKIPDAHRALRRLLYLAIVAGDILIEIDARRRLARLYESINEMDSALVAYVLVGDDKQVVQVAPQAGDVVAHDWINHPAPWVRAAGWAAVRGRADLLADAEIDAIAVSAIRDATAGAHRSWSGPDVFLQSTRVLAALAARLTSARAGEVLDTTIPWIDREQGTYRRADDPMVEIFAVIHKTHSELQSRAGDALLRSLDLLGDQQLVTRLIMRCDQPSRQLVGGLTSRAEAGNDAAADLLAFFCIEHPKARERAEQKASAILAMPIDADRSSWSFGVGYSFYRGHADLLSARRRGEVARKLAELAADTSDIALSRTEALDTLDSIAGSLSSGQRAGIFPRIIGLAIEDPELSMVDQANELTLHPLSRSRIDLGVGELRPTALRCAASLATSRDRARQCQRAAQWVVRSNDQHAQIAAALTFVRTASVAPIDPADMLMDDRPFIRRAGIAIWAANPSSASSVPALAEDQDQNVRFELAAHLDELQANGAPGVTELGRQLGTDVSANVRARAHQSP